MTERALVAAPPAVDDYVEGVEVAHREEIRRLRDACRPRLRGFSEQVRYAMPSYCRDGKVEIALEAQRRHISRYVLRRDVMASVAHALVGHDTGKGCVRFSYALGVDVDLVAEILRVTASTRGETC